MPEDVLGSESKRLYDERAGLEKERLVHKASQDRPIHIKKLERDLPQVLSCIQRWVLNAHGEELALLLRALDIRIKASREQALIEGTIPPLPLNGTTPSTQPDLVTTEQTSA